jgi:hypothetical protein
MRVQPFVLRSDQHEPVLNAVGTQVTVLASNAATHSHGIILQQGEEGTGPPPHRHDWDGPPDISNASFAGTRKN